MIVVDLLETVKYHVKLLLRLRSDLGLSTVMKLDLLFEVGN